MHVVGAVLGGAVILLLIRLAVPPAIREDWRWSPLLVAALVGGVFLGAWVGSLLA